MASPVLVNFLYAFLFAESIYLKHSRKSNVRNDLQFFKGNEEMVAKPEKKKKRGCFLRFSLNNDGFEKKSKSNLKYFVKFFNKMHVRSNSYY